jgi:hypothetical protein
MCPRVIAQPGGESYYDRQLLVNKMSILKKSIAMAPQGLARAGFVGDGTVSTEYETKLLGAAYGSMLLFRG